MSPFDPRTCDNQEAAMVHAPSTAFFDLPLCQTAFMRMTQERAAAGQQPWPWPTSKPEAKPEAGTVPPFDSEAHRQFMRSLG